MVDSEMAQPSNSFTMWMVVNFGASMTGKSSCDGEGVSGNTVGVAGGTVGVLGTNVGVNGSVIGTSVAANCPQARVASK
jgi:hypothetical protein